MCEVVFVFIFMARPVGRGHFILWVFFVVGVGFGYCGGTLDVVFGVISAYVWFYVLCFVGF